MLKCSDIISFEDWTRIKGVGLIVDGLVIEIFQMSNLNRDLLPQSLKAFLECIKISTKTHTRIFSNRFLWKRKLKTDKKEGDKGYFHTLHWKEEFLRLLGVSFQLHES